MRTTLHGQRQYLLVVLAFTVAFGLGAGMISGQSREGGKPTTVYLVRHAEKIEPGMTADTDPSLSADGRVRAEKLAGLLSGCSISAVYTTPFKRTTETAQAVVEKSKIEGSPIAVSPREMASLLDQIRKASSKNHLVVGHSNTIPAIARALAGRDDAAPDIPETSYDNLFVVTITRWEPREATVKLFRFGAPSTPPSTLPEFTGCSK